MPETPHWARPLLEAQTQVAALEGDLAAARKRYDDLLLEAIDDHIQVEIAEALGTNQPTISRALTRARKRKQNPTTTSTTCRQ